MLVYLAVMGIADKMLVFGMSENLSKLADLDTVYVDVTFATCLALYCQLFTCTINGFINGQQFPLVKVKPLSHLSAYSSYE